MNQQKAPHSTRQPNVVLGLSMGGLVGRYALRDMETNGLNILHDTCLFISNDSPHQGANVPLSAQAAVRHLSGVGIGFGVPGIYYYITLAEFNDDLNNAATLLGTPAARQMLQYQLAGSGHSIVFNNSAYTTFMNEYRNLGYPTQVRNVAIASGSECAPQQAFGPYATLLNIDESFKLKYWQGLLASILSPFTSYFPQLFLGFPLTTKTELKANFVLNALPDHQALRIYKGKISISKKILFVINVSMALVDKAFNSSSSMLPLDSAPGGVFDINEFGGISAPTMPTDPVFSFPRFCFVPTTSSLDIGRGTQTITTADLLRVYTPSSPPPAPKNVPFANFFTHPIANIRHTQFTQQNGQWLMNEVRNANPTFNCTQYCSLNPTITGGAVSVCYGSNKTFNISGASGLPVQWVASSNLRVISQNNTSITVTALSSTTSGPAWIDANVGGTFCGIFPAPRRNITAGPYSTSQISVSGQVPVCPGSQYWYTASPTGTSYSWTYPSGWSVVSQSGNQIALYVPTYSPLGER